MTSSLHRRSLQDVDALGLFHHGRGLGRHLSRQSSDDSRRRSSANLQNLAGSVTHLAGSMTGRTAIIFFLFIHYHIRRYIFMHVYRSQTLYMNERQEMYLSKNCLNRTWIPSGAPPIIAEYFKLGKITITRRQPSLSPPFLFPKIKVRPNYNIGRPKKIWYLL